ASGMDSDYNDWFSSNTYNTIQWGDQTAQFSSGWLGKDGNSISANPFWANPSAGIEDFHPMSTTSNGRYNMATATFNLSDGLQSQTIDAGDPGEDVAIDSGLGLEPENNGDRANLGSYGLTAQASKSPDVAFASVAGCGLTKNVKKDPAGYIVDSSSITGALAVLPATLPDNACVVIRDTETYSEQVTVQNFAFTYGTNTLRIMADPTFVSSAPVINPPTSSTAAFQIANSSVSIENLSIVSTNSLAYGIWSSSSHLSVSSLSLIGGTPLWEAAIAISSFSRVDLASVTVYDATGLRLFGTGSSVMRSTFLVTGSNINQWAVSVLGSTNALTSLRISNSQGSGLAFNYSSFNTISLSTLTSSRAGSSALAFFGANNTAVASYFQNQVGDGLRFYSNYNTVSHSTVAGGGAGGSAAYFSAYSFNTISDSWLHSAAGNTLSFSQGTNNTILRSTMTNSSTAPTIVLGGNASSNTISQSYIGHTISTAITILGAHYNTISHSTISSDGPGWAAYFSGASGNRISSATILSSTGLGAVFVSGSSYNVVDVSSFSASGTALQISAASNTITGSFARSRNSGLGLYLAGSGSYNSVQRSSATAAWGQRALGLDGGFNQIQDSYFYNLSAGDSYAGVFNGNSNQIVASTFTSNASSGNTIRVNSSYNTFTRCRITNENSVNGYVSLHLNSGNGTTIDSSVLWAANDSALLVVNSNSNRIRDSELLSGMVIGNDSDSNTLIGNRLTSLSITDLSDSARISYSTITAGLTIDNGTNHAIYNSYVQGSNGATITASTGTVARASTFLGTGSSGHGLHLSNSVGLTASSNVFQGGASGYGLRLSGNGGVIAISTNSMQTTKFGLFVSTQMAGTSVWIGSNTVVSSISASADTYGIYLNGLQTGATIQNNAIVFRSAGGTAGRSYYGLYGQSVRSLKFDHNR
ncbi:MAG: right-handed parallel beta-helix repeat-containing protein, partial [Elusimicrobia bacterium]|nr:right-handed parallel beta-helix repeat-containing protein [Elusimicrobiota bacterium]